MLTNLEVRILLEIKTTRGAYLTKISKKVCTTAYSLKMFNNLEKLGLIKTIKLGRRKNVELTEKGNKVVNLIMEINSLLK